ncbi:hypothetical protein L2E82_02922 [Cichorium intybus]|uniref:Uncharacterized protein n=1 Tax=Cichorium intybus TaxID=13427 RepID=A0ACB9H3U4_CICIN|nr:hypothetical protein L2E82_02922 [Cichorium intybus]
MTVKQIKDAFNEFTTDGLAVLLLLIGKLNIAMATMLKEKKMVIAFSSQSLDFYRNSMTIITVSISEETRLIRQRGGSDCKKGFLKNSTLTRSIGNETIEWKRKSLSVPLPPNSRFFQNLGFTNLADTLYTDGYKCFIKFGLSFNEFNQSLLGFTIRGVVKETDRIPGEREGHFGVFQFARCQIHPTHKAINDKSLISIAIGFYPCFFFIIISTPKAHLQGPHITYG